jgi:hypothetical protein
MGDRIEMTLDEGRRLGATKTMTTTSWSVSSRFRLKKPNIKQGDLLATGFLLVAL